MSSEIEQLVGLFRLSQLALLRKVVGLPALDFGSESAARVGWSLERRAR